MPSFLITCIGLSFIIVSLGIFIALYNVSTGYRKSKDIVKKATQPSSPEINDGNELARKQLETQLEQVQNRRFGVPMLAPDDTVMGGNPNAAAIVKNKDNGQRRRSPDIRRSRPERRYHTKRDAEERRGKKE